MHGLKAAYIKLLKVSDRACTWKILWAGFSTNSLWKGANSSETDPDHLERGCKEKITYDGKGENT